MSSNYRTGNFGQARGGCQVRSKSKSKQNQIGNQLSKKAELTTSGTMGGQTIEKMFSPRNKDRGKERFPSYYLGVGAGESPPHRDQTRGGGTVFAEEQKLLHHANTITQQITHHPEEDSFSLNASKISKDSSMSVDSNNSHTTLQDILDATNKHNPPHNPQLVTATLPSRAHPTKAGKMGGKYGMPSKGVGSGSNFLELREGGGKKKKHNRSQPKNGKSGGSSSSLLCGEHLENAKLNEISAHISHMLKQECII